MDFVMHCAVCLGTKDLEMVSARRGDKIIAAVFVCKNHADDVEIELTAKSANGHHVDTLKEIFGMAEVG